VAEGRGGFPQDPLPLAGGVAEGRGGAGMV